MPFRCAIFCALALISGAAIADETRYPVPKGAIDVKHVRLADNGGEQDYFDVRLGYPSTRVVDHYRKVFKSWIECKPSNEWALFSDRRGSNPIFVHQSVWHWVRSDDNAIVTLAIRYYSNGSEYRVKPDSDIQHVVLIEYASPEARTEAEKMGAICGPHT